MEVAKTGELPTKIGEFAKTGEFATKIGEFAKLGEFPTKLDEFAKMDEFSTKISEFAKMDELSVKIGEITKFGESVAKLGEGSTKIDEWGTKYVSPEDPRGMPAATILARQLNHSPSSKKPAKNNPSRSMCTHTTPLPPCCNTNVF